ncbi:membrane-associated progesterone receptor component 1-like [Toxorhynchites rutilus septentrionalis]|uniref:membrane-associated progesterone receptor component 1-like n=1 Tax=Toxorhynchites rutilus septentrionalis TaxID=329112 RepID=UPI002479B434|nr:membrane-associated progesterone receptor component 1-like [Toxorhynchites rutilus septentrionalis]
MAEESILTESGTMDPAGSITTEEQVGFLASIVNEIIYSPLNVVLVGVITFLVYKIFHSRQQPASSPPPEPELPRLRQDMTAAELRKYDGNQPDGRVLVAVNGNVYDVTKGKRFYGPGGPYAAFGGRDASRGLATFSVSCNEKDYDDLSDLSPMEMESVREWEMQFKEKYVFVGRLLKPGEEPTSYSDEEEETPNDTSTPSATESASAPAATATITTAPAPRSPKKESKSSSEATTAAAAAVAPSKVEEIKPDGEAKGKDEE